MNESTKRNIIHDGPHTKEALNVLSSSTEIKADSLKIIAERAARILEYAVDPVEGPVEPSYGLLYGLIQSGKTSIITVTTAMSADNGFKCIVILTSDINPLYNQTLQRIRSHLRGLTVLGKADWLNDDRFQRQIRTPPFAIVCSKNKNHLSSLLESFKRSSTLGARNLPTLIIDDEADQASLNTYMRKGTGEISAINNLITEIRGFFQKNTYLQVTATPQALFLQSPEELYRPSFTVLSEPGPAYIGGEAFFEDDSKLLRIVSLEEVDELRSGHQPSPTHKIPDGLRSALINFFIGAAAKNIQYPTENFAFLCHISHTRIQHKHTISVIDAFREDAVNGIKDKASRAFDRLMTEFLSEYQDIAKTEPELPEFEKILKRVAFLLPAANIKEINATSNETVTPDHVYSVFVGGNKLGRGVTIPNLITSYYGRNPRRPNADTVLQHARMYGYRQKHIGVTRLFLPSILAEHFRLIHQMEKALRELVKKYPEGKFEGIYIASPLQATRPNVLDPNSIGIYVAGGNCAPRYPLRNEEVIIPTKWLDDKLAVYDNNRDYYESDIDSIIEIIQRCSHDPDMGADLWNIKILIAALEKIRILRGTKAYIRVSRGHELNEPRRETQGFLSGGEAGLVPRDAPTLFIYKLKESRGKAAAWWPQIRFPEGNYALAFSFDR